MQWDFLFNTKRLETQPTSLSIVEDAYRDSPDLISPLQKDVDRILFSSPFRRLQGKAQVFMFPDTDFVRTRLTHSIEVTSVGRLLANAIFKQMLVNCSLDPSTKDVQRCLEFRSALASETELGGIHVSDLVSAITAACYSHDIGNAPFGHIGEFAIRSWFKDAAAEKILRRPGLPQLSQKVTLGDGSVVRPIDDYIEFDGNPQGFRILTNNAGWKESGGLQLCYTTLASMIKYPYSVGTRLKPGKFGYFQSEEKSFRQIWDTLGLFTEAGEALRHPFSYVVEAADDIAYCVSDIEDAAKVGLVTHSEALRLFRNVAPDGKIIKERYAQIDRRDRAGQVRFMASAATVRLINNCAQTFVTRIDDIMRVGLLNEDGVPTSLLSSCDARIALFEQQVRDKCKAKVYPQPRKLINEQGAYEQVRYLLGLFAEAVGAFIERDDKTEMHENILSILFKREWEPPADARADDLFRRVVDFVSGMTDRYASNMYQNLRGISLDMRR